MTNSIEKRIEIAAPVARVWKALTDHEEFGQWFRVKLDAPFALGQVSTGHITHPGYEHVKWKATVREIAPLERFSFTWHPYAVEPGVDYSAEEPTLVEFRLAPSGTGTLLVVTETGFDRIPEGRRALALRMNDGGWAQQVENIKRHVTQQA